MCDIIFTYLVIIYWLLILIFIILTTYSSAPWSMSWRWFSDINLKKERVIRRPTAVRGKVYIGKVRYQKISAFDQDLSNLRLYWRKCPLQWTCKHKKGVIPGERNWGRYLGLHFSLGQQSMESMTLLKGNV